MLTDDDVLAYLEQKYIFNHGINSSCIMNEEMVNAVQELREAMGKDPSYVDPMLLIHPDQLKRR